MSKVKSTIGIVSCCRKNEVDIFTLQLNAKEVLTFLCLFE